VWASVGTFPLFYQAADNNIQRRIEMTIRAALHSHHEFGEVRTTWNRIVDVNLIQQIPIEGIVAPLNV